MLFNSLEFAIFLPIVFILYWFVFNRNLKVQNLFLIAASYVFYGWWDWRFLLLIVFSSLTDYLTGLGIQNSKKPDQRKLFLIISLLVNFGLLGTFKYFNFFIDSFISAFSLFGVVLQERSLNIILPVGISFYTFQTVSYTIDVYRKKIPATRDIIAFFAYVSFFPQLVAGPIERAANFLPQFDKERSFDLEKAKDGMRQILWGIFKKVVIADNIAILVDRAFLDPGSLSAGPLLLGQFLFGVQLYCDFSGYSDVGIGTARLFGFRLMRNFAFPFFSRDLAEWWRRWHISLTSWFKDYIYIPLGGSKNGPLMLLRNFLVMFVVSGFWHGAKWTFVFWGLINGLLVIPSALMGKNRKYLDIVAQDRLLPNLKELGQMALNVFLLQQTITFFRAVDMKQAFLYLKRLYSTVFLAESYTSLLEFVSKEESLSLVFLAGLIITEWFQRKKQHGLEIGRIPKVLRWFCYTVILFIILFFGRFDYIEYIYFQF